MGGWIVALFDWILIAVAVAVLVAAGVWQRAKPKSEHAPITPNVALIALPIALSSVSVNLILGALATAIVALIAFMNPSHLTITAPSLILPAVGCLIALRPNPPASVFTAVSFVVGCAITLQAVRVSKSKASALVSLIDGVGLFLVVSVLLWLAGFSGNEGRTAGLKNALTGGERVTFPLSSSLPTTSAMAAIYLAAVIPIVIVYRQHRLPRLAAAGCGAAVFILTDSRASLLAALFVSGCVLLAPKLFRRAAPWLVAATLAMPFLYTAVRNDVGQLMSDYLPWMIRHGEEAATLNRRDYIWSRALEFYSDRVDDTHQAIGYGTFGHAASGASAAYNDGLRGFGGEQRLVTPHSSVLQMLFDGGWLAVALFAVTLVAMALKRIDIAGLSMLVTLSLVGVTEVALAPSHALPTWWVLVTLGAVTFAQDRRVPGRDSPRSTQGSSVSLQRAQPSLVEEIG